MKNTTVRRLLFATAYVLFTAGNGAQAGVFCDFEPPLYINDASFLGVDGWTATVDAPFSAVTPHVGSGYRQTLQGSQSAVIGDADHSRYRSFKNSPKLSFPEVTVISWLWQRPDGLGVSSLYVSDNARKGTTPVGIQFDTTGNILLVGNTTGESDRRYLPKKTYLMEIVIDFDAHQFEAFFTNVTDDEPRGSLGTGAFDKKLAPADFLSDGGIILHGNGATLIDDIRVDAPKSKAGK
ncbi:MAG: hypothetical protein HY360_24795 [Verrucomicrobia bacterium]|nr:hypothetical protein [Verrucomicrobiota bacterium]